MTGPDRPPGDGPTREQPVVAPSVATAPAQGRGRFSRIPSHLGRARTSTVVLAVLFVGIFGVYLAIRPAEPGAASSTTPDTGTEQPAPATTPTPTPTTTAPETTTEPTTSAPTPTRTPTTAPEETSTEEPTDTTVPQETAETAIPTFSSPATRGSTPTLGSPPG